MLTRPTFDVNNIQGLATRTTGQAVAVKVLHDKAGADAKTYLIALCDQLDLDFATKIDLVNAILGEFPDGSIDDIKLSNADGQIKNRLIDHIEDNSRHVWEKIAEQTLAEPTAQINFANIPSGYKNFRLIFESRNGAASVSNLELILNDDVSNNYRSQKISGNSTSISTVGVVAQSNISLTDALPASSSTYSCGRIEISNSNQLRAKVINGEWYAEKGTGATTLWKHIIGGIWANTLDEISKISIKGFNLASIGTGSRFVLRGCK